MSTPKINSDNFSECASQDRSQRLFFALWPDDTLRQQLVHRSRPLVQAAHGRPVPAENLHMTLAFLGNVNARQRDCVERMAETIACPSFDLALNCFGHWSRSQVLWFAPRETPEPLTRLVDVLAVGVRECGLSLDARPYRPHLTLARKVSSAPENKFVEPITWPVGHFVLVRSVPVPQGVAYEVVREWPLGEHSETTPSDVV